MIVAICGVIAKGPSMASPAILRNPAIPAWEVPEEVPRGLVSVDWNPLLALKSDSINWNLFWKSVRISSRVTAFRAAPLTISLSPEPLHADSFNSVASLFGVDVNIFLKH